MSIVEKMARAICCGEKCRARMVCLAPEYRKEASAALTATGLTEAQLEGLANGTMVVVPVEPTEAMKDAGFNRLCDHASLTPEDVYRAMLAAKEG